MRHSATWRRTAILVGLLLFGLVVTAEGQSEKGGLYGTVTDEQGADLPGVAVTLSGVGAPQVQVTDARGEFRFPAMSIGRYSLRAELDGFSTVEYPTVVISANRNTTLEIMLTAAVQEVITVTAESPLLDERKVAVGTTISQVELEKIPTARDPWSVMSQTQGVLVDRINVGGNQSGQQSNFRAPGSDRYQNDFLVDGVQITDMAATGSSPSYYDFDQFEEMQFETGGTDVTKVVPGVAVNLVTKRGTNEMRGSARYFLTDASGYFGALDQGSADVSGDLAPGQTSISGNEIDRIQDYGFEAGGPLVVDRVWVWGSWARNDVRQFAANGVPDNTELENTAVKFNAQISDSNSALGSFNNGDKVKQGRDASPQRPAETTLNQRGPTGIYKIEDTHIFGSSLFVTGMWSKVDGGFGFVSQGQLNAGCSGTDCPLSLEPLIGADGIWRNSYYAIDVKRPAEEWRADGAWFFDTGAATSHEMKFGARVREFESGSSFAWPGRNLLHIAGPAIGLPEGLGYMEAYRASWPHNTLDYQSLWVQDTINRGNWTLNAGLRWDVSDGENTPDVLEGNVAFPALLPTLDFPGNDGGGVEYDTISPRLGLTYALGEDRKTLLRASLARFPEVLGSDPVGPINRVNPLGFSVASFLFEDLDGDYIWTDGEPLIFLSPSGFDPLNPTALVSPNRNDPGLDPAMTDQVILSAERALLPEFVVGANFTWARTTDIQDLQRFVRDTSTGLVRTETRADYVSDGTITETLPDGTAVNVPLFALHGDLEPTGGYFLTNGDRELEYMGLGLTWTKRLANRWMARGYFNYGLSEEWSVPGDYLDPGNGPVPAEDKSDCDGCLLATQSAASGFFEDVWMQSTWSWNANGMYQVAPDRPWGFNVAANLYGREGFPLPYFADNVVGSDGITRDVSLVADTDDFRSDDLFTVDLRLEKEFLTGNQTSFTVALDGFNVFDENYVLQRNRALNGTRPDFLDETLSPRIWRLGVRINWR